MNHTSNDILNDLVAAARDGKSFYEHAATRVKNPELKTLFARLAKVKGEIAQGLSSEIRSASDKPVEVGAWVGDLERLYADARSHLSDKNYVYVAQLEESEDQLIKASYRALDGADLSTHARTIINRLLPEVRHCHELIQAQKIALKKAA